MLQKRYAQVNSWLEHVQDDGRVHGRVTTNGAVTGRMTHQTPNMAQVPSSNSEYGKECRECWIVPEGRKLVGADASGLELRMLAHYMNDQEFTNVLLKEDIHTRNQVASGLATRPQAKTFIYAFLYGAGDAKIGSIVGGSARDGSELRQRFLRNTPALETLRTRVGAASKRGHLRGIDGRKLWVRSEHSALNTLLQAAGAIVMKKALVILESKANVLGLDYKIVGNIHDEIQSEVATEQAEKFGRLAVESIKEAGVSFKLRCPLDGEYQSWRLVGRDALMDQLCFFEHEDLGAGHGKVCSKCNQYLPLDAYNMASERFCTSGSTASVTTKCRRYASVGTKTGCQRRAITAPSAKDQKDVKGTGNTRNGSWVLDHDHEQETFRGWLCHKCNRALGVSTIT